MLRLVSSASLLVAAAAVAQCDPSGVPFPRPPGEIPIENELFKDELAARGTCRVESVPGLGVDELRDLIDSVSQESSRTTCTGVCEPMRKKLVPLGEAHDLEDLTFQRECGVATAGLPPAAREPCLRVCVVERRRVGAKAVWARTVRLLQRAFPHAEAPGDPAAAREVLSQQRLGVPPSSIRVEAMTQEKDRPVRAEGWLYPGGGLLRLRTSLMSAGCGASAWGVRSW